MNKDKEFPKGFYYKESHANAPDFVKGGASIKVDEFIKYLKSVNRDWLNLDFKISRDGKPYAEVNTFEPTSRGDEPRTPTTEPVREAKPVEDDDEMPF